MFSDVLNLIDSKVIEQQDIYESAVTKAEQKFNKNVAALEILKEAVNVISYDEHEKWTTFKEIEAKLDEAGVLDTILRCNSGVITSLKKACLADSNKVNISWRDDGAGEGEGTSGWIHKITWDPEEEAATMETDKGEFTYNIDFETFNKWIECRSKGRFWHSNIKGKF